MHISVFRAQQTIFTTTEWEGIQGVINYNLIPQEFFNEDQYDDIHTFYVINSINHS